jgi:hypothetical protein
MIFTGIGKLPSRFLFTKCNFILTTVGVITSILVICLVV